MKALLFILLATTLSCGTHEKKKDCRIESDTPEFTVIACGKQKTIITKGKDGENGSQGNTGASGSDGTNGVDGLSTVFAVVNADTCPAGGSHILMATDSNRSGALEPSDANLTSATICNGENGQAGTNGSDGQDGVDGTNGTDAPPTAFSIVNVIDPCGDSPSVVDEVFLKLANGTLLASMSDNANGKNTRFSVLYPGSFLTTDGSGCYFTVTSDNQITNEHY